jgi:hypothetical protein
MKTISTNTRFFKKEGNVVTALETAVPHQKAPPEKKGMLNSQILMKMVFQDSLFPLVKNSVFS